MSGLSNLSKFVLSIELVGHQYLITIYSISSLELEFSVIYQQPLGSPG